MNKSNDTIANRTRDLPAFSPVPQSTVAPRAPVVVVVVIVVIVTVKKTTSQYFQV